MKIKFKIFYLIIAVSLIITAILLHGNRQDDISIEAEMLVGLFLVFLYSALDLYISITSHKYTASTGLIIAGIIQFFTLLIYIVLVISIYHSGLEYFRNLAEGIKFPIAIGVIFLLGKFLEAFFKSGRFKKAKNDQC